MYLLFIMLIASQHFMSICVGFLCAFFFSADGVYGQLKEFFLQGMRITKSIHRGFSEIRPHRERTALLPTVRPKQEHHSLQAKGSVYS